MNERNVSGAREIETQHSADDVSVESRSLEKVNQLRPEEGQIFPGLFRRLAGIVQPGKVDEKDGLRVVG